jgi:GTP-binding protein HflX
VKARTYAADQLFATLDTTTRQLYLGDKEGRGRSVSLSDTVGFIRDLPHTLVDAFEATLQEAAQADLLLHVVDAANPDFPEQMAQVQAVLADIGAADVPQLLVFNKMDALPAERLPQRLQDDYEIDGRPVPRIFVSAANGAGLSALREALSQRALAGVAAYDLEEDPQNVMEPVDSVDSGPTFRHNG